jgi:tRNA A-37 threonylcarbamoyl transferase component Bud32
VRSFARGGLGEVFVAYDEELDREVALKEIQAPFADNVQSRTRFVREGKVTGGLEHPGIVPVYGLGTYQDGRPYYAMRFIKGESLQHAITHFHQDDVPGRDPGERALAFRQLLRRFIDVCNAIAYAHSRDVLHRDLKPANVMLGAYGETLVVDWGLAKAVGQREAATGSGGTAAVMSTAAGEGVTQAGAVIGTPAYMSPEQAAGKQDEVGPAADVYSLGATLYCLLTGQAPIEEPNMLLTLARVQTGEFPPPRRVKPKVPVPLEAICLKAMALQPNDRYGSARALADDLEHWLADEPVAARRESAWEWAKRLCRHHPVFAAGMGFLVAMDLALVIVGIALALGQAAMAFVPFAVLGAAIMMGLCLMVHVQVWWLLGAAVGALLGSRGARSGGLLGLMIGGSLAWWAVIARGNGLGPVFSVYLSAVAVAMAPLAGAAVGLLLGTPVIPRRTKARKQKLLGSLVGTAIGFLVGSFVAVLFTEWSATLPILLSRTIGGALTGVALGTIGGAFPGNAKRAMGATFLGALIGATVAIILLVFATRGFVATFPVLRAVLVGGLLGATLGALLAACRDEVKKRVVWAAFLGGRVGLAGGTALLGLVATGVLVYLSKQLGSMLPLVALPLCFAPIVIDVGLGLMNRARWDHLLTRVTRSGMIGLLLSGSVGYGIFMAGLSGSATEKVRQSANRMQTSNNLKQMAVAMHNYHNSNQRFPAAAICDEQGKPLLSWRVAILPFVEQQHLHKLFKLDEPWDSAHNRRLLPLMPKVYALPGKLNPGEKTHYRVFTGGGAMFELQQGYRLTDIRDGTSNTLMIVEAAEAVPWTKPDELVYDPKGPLPKLGGGFGSGFNAAFASGSVTFLSSTLPESTLRALITRAGGEQIGKLE